MSLSAYEPPQNIYVAITIAHNEAATLTRTIAAVRRHISLPAQWVIVNDRSTDQTAGIINNLAAECPWVTPIHLTTPPGPGEPPIPRALNTATSAITASGWEYLVRLDADVDFESDALARMFVGMADRGFGIAGASVIDPNAPRIPAIGPDVAGAFEVISRECWSAIGETWPVTPWAAEDQVVCMLARAHGFKTGVIRDLWVDHLKPRSHVNGWRAGRRDAANGACFLFEVVKCVGRLRQRPLLVGGICRFAGYLYHQIAAGSTISPMAVKQTRAEQYRRLFRCRTKPAAA